MLWIKKSILCYLIFAGYVFASSTVASGVKSGGKTTPATSFPGRWKQPSTCRILKQKSRSSRLSSTYRWQPLDVWGCHETCVLPEVVQQLQGVLVPSPLVGEGQGDGAFGCRTIGQILTPTLSHSARRGAK